MSRIMFRRNAKLGVRNLWPSRGCQTTTPIIGYPRWSWWESQFSNIWKGTDSPHLHQTIAWCCDNKLVQGWNHAFSPLFFSCTAKDNGDLGSNYFPFPRVLMCHFVWTKNRSLSLTMVRFKTSRFPTRSWGYKYIPLTETEGKDVVQGQGMAWKATVNTGRAMNGLQHECFSPMCHPWLYPC